MVPRPPKVKLTADELEIIKPKTEKAKVEKTKATPKSKIPKVKVEKAEASDKPKKIKDEPKKMKDERPAVKDGKAEKGEKVKAVTGDEAVKLILEYLKSQNRPFSATEVSANLHGKVTKTVADKLMKEMEQDQQIIAKATNGDKKGSQWVFWPIQDPADAASPEELAAMDEAINDLRTSMPALKSNAKSITAKLSMLKYAPSTSELASTIEALRHSNALKASKLAGLKTAGVTQVTKAEMVRVEKDFKYWVTKKKLRKLAYHVIEDQLAEGLTREQIREKAGIEDADSEWVAVE